MQESTLPCRFMLNVSEPEIKLHVELYHSLAWCKYRKRWLVSTKTIKALHDIIVIPQPIKLS